MEDHGLRIARTESLFRDVNERVAEAADRFDASEAAFVCECADAACTDRIEAPLDEYERVRADGAQFLLVPGHEDTRVERVVRARRRWLAGRRLLGSLVAPARTRVVRRRRSSRPV